MQRFLQLIVEKKLKKRAGIRSTFKTLSLFSCTSFAIRWNIQRMANV